MITAFFSVKNETPGTVILSFESFINDLYSSELYDQVLEFEPPQFTGRIAESWIKTKRYSVCNIKILPIGGNCNVTVYLFNGTDKQAFEEKFIQSLLNYIKKVFNDVEITADNSKAKQTDIPQSVSAATPKYKKGEKYRLKVAYLVEREYDDGRGIAETLKALEMKVPGKEFSERKVRGWRKKLSLPENQPLLEEIKREIKESERKGGGKRKKAEDFF